MNFNGFTLKSNKANVLIPTYIEEAATDTSDSFILYDCGVRDISSSIYSQQNFRDFLKYCTEILNNGTLTIALHEGFTIPIVGILNDDLTQSDKNIFAITLNDELMRKFGYSNISIKPQRINNPTAGFIGYYIIITITYSGSN